MPFLTGARNRPKPLAKLWNLPIGILFVLRGLVHLLWFVVPWRITAVDGLHYATTLLAAST